MLIVENDRIQIYDEYLNPVSYKVGYYYGLAAGKKDEVYTISYLKGKEIAIQKLCIGPNGFYKFDGQIKLKIREGFQKNKLESPLHLLQIVRCITVRSLLFTVQQ